MMDLDKIAGRMLDLESKYYELQEKYQLLIHHYEDLKVEYEARWDLIFGRDKPKEQEKPEEEQPKETKDE